MGVGVGSYRRPITYNATPLDFSKKREKIRGRTSWSTSGSEGENGGESEDVRPLKMHGNDKWWKRL